MSLYVCDNCGIVDNTALTNFWKDWLEAKRVGGSGEFRALCSACDPTSETRGRWHGKFPARNMAEWGYVFLKRKPFVGKAEWDS